MKMSRWRCMPGLAFVIVVGVAGCSASGQGTAETSLAGEGDQSDLERLLQEFSEVTEAAEEASAVLVEERVAACMQAEGFDYVPAPHVPARMNPADLGVLPGTREFAEQYGYGIATDPWGRLESASPTPAADPNAEMLSTMSPAEVEAYYAALYGTSGPDEPYNWRTGGCAGGAEHEVNGVVPGLDDDALADLQEELVTVLSITSDPSLESLAGEWAQCMSDAGHPGFTSVDEPAAQIAKQAAETPDHEDLAEEEKALATADFDCRSEVGYAKALRAVQVERQNEFYAANRTEFEAWLDVLRERAAG